MKSIKVPESNKVPKKPQIPELDKKQDHETSIYLNHLEKAMHLIETVKALNHIENFDPSLILAKKSEIFERKTALIDHALHLLQTHLEQVKNKW